MRKTRLVPPPPMGLINPMVWHLLGVIPWRLKPNVVGVPWQD